ncbi:Tropomodulin-1 [Manis pentadactyla]|nr:Tropomodulin-1 [Manis pentadactyla]
MAVAPANLVTKATDARKLSLMASGIQSATSPVDPMRMEVSATKKLETVTVHLVTQEKPVCNISIIMEGHTLMDMKSVYLKSLETIAVSSVTVKEEAHATW